MKRYLEVIARPKYWKDSELNGASDIKGEMPCRYGDYWEPLIDLSDGKIVNWKEGNSAKIHYKVCDEGRYFIMDENKQRVAEWGFPYVPRDLLNDGEDDDYIILEVDKNGYIEKFNGIVKDEQWREIKKSEDIDKFYVSLTEENYSSLMDMGYTPIPWVKEQRGGVFSPDKVFAVSDGQVDIRREQNVIDEGYTKGFKNTEKVYLVLKDGEDKYDFIGSDREAILIANNEEDAWKYIDRLQIPKGKIEVCYKVAYKRWVKCKLIAIKTLKVIKW